MGGNLNVPSLNGGQLAGFRNRFINGDMRIMVRPAHAPVLSATDFHVDRWFLYSEGAANASASLLATPIGGPGLNRHYFSIFGAAGNTLTQVWQRVEAENVADLKNQVVTVSALVYTQDTRVVTLDLRHPNARDNYSGNTVVAQVATPAAAGWRKVSAQFTMPNNTFGVQLGVDFGAVGAGIEVTCTDVQLEAGPVATPFETRPYQLELILCRRYYCMWFGNGSTQQGIGMGVFTSATNFFFTLPLPAPLRLPQPTLLGGLLLGLGGLLLGLGGLFSGDVELLKRLMFFASFLQLGGSLRFLRGRQPMAISVTPAQPGALHIAIGTLPKAQANPEAIEPQSGIFCV
jgi:hypothetical protein